MTRAVAAFIYLFVFAAELQAQETPYYNPATGGYYQSRQEACVSAIPAVTGFLEANASSSRAGQTVTATYTGYALNYCQYTYTWSGGGGGTGSMNTSLGTSAAHQLSACSIGEIKTSSVPVGREIDGVYTDFGSYYTSKKCYSGCEAVFNGGGGITYVTPGDGNNYVYEDLEYELTGASCSADSADPSFSPPESPDPEPDPEPETPTDPEPTPDPDDGGGTGGTGGGTGGDSGGGDSGGIPIDPPDDGLPDPGDTGGDTGGSNGGDTGGSTGGDTGGATGGDTGGSTGGSTGGDDGAGNSAGGLACNQPLTCEGDPVQCAILRTQKEQLCSDLDGADFEGHKGEIESLFSGPDFQREADEEVTVPSFVTGITRFFPSNSCPADASVSLSSFGGRTLKFSFEPICSFATALGPLIVIAATVFAALYVGRAFGGE